MCGECNDENVCGATAHYYCAHCGENLCFWHWQLHKLKHALLGRCYLWRHPN